MQTAVVGLVAALAVIFGVSAFGKARSRAALRGFTTSLRGWRVVPVPLVGAVAVAVAGLEIVVVAGALAALATSAAGSAWRPFAVGTLGLSAILLAGLSGGIALALRRGPGATCACFGATERPLNAGHLWRDVVLVLACAVGVALAVGAGSHATDPAGTIVATFAGAVVGLLVARLDDLIDLFSYRTN
ncbi:MauE/DoxX family redox-associated membrane protein [Cryptosporangium sp. NPDC048952]|uniref:MauE/DoxX family redox-associated membrane protein n=1 Tax=Cryptosporangium sp. NPDC048952 TaxID=3363961 RepID=UPI003716B2F1